MKILPIQMTKNSPSFGEKEIQSPGYDPYSKNICKRDLELAKCRQYARRTNKIRQEMLDELAKSIEGKKLNLFQKIGYAVKKAKIKRMIF